MTNQEVYDRVKAHLLTQKKQAREGMGWCKYRTKDGLKCAIGCLIPDDSYHPGLEGQSAWHPSVLLATGLAPEQRHFARALQEVHDHYHVPEWERELARIAVRHGLEP